MQIENWNLKIWSGFLKYFFAIQIQKFCSNYAYLQKAAAMIMSTLLCVMLSSCAQEIPRRFQVPASVMPYIIEFELQATLHGKNIKIDDLIVKIKPEIASNSAVGLCYYSANGSTPEIHLLEWYWNLASDIHRENLVFHELGHCILGRKHDNDIGLSGVPESIMNYYLIAPHQYETNRAILLQELFGNAKLY